MSIKITSGTLCLLALLPCAAHAVPAAQGLPVEVVFAGGKPRYGVVAGGAWRHDFGAAGSVQVRSLATGEVFGK